MTPESAGAAPGGPLSGCRVVELSHIMAGPVCGLMLSDMGADVIKIEKPGGDDTRRYLPPDVGGESAAFMMMNRGKRGAVLNLKTPAGRDALLRLLASADVMVENHRAGTLEKLGLGPDELRAKFPGLIVVSISGYGRTGPLAAQGGFDLVAQGYSGLMSVTGEAPGCAPCKIAPPISDITAGVLAAMGAAAAWAQKLQTGEGSHVDTSLFEAAVTQTYWQSAIGFATGVAPEPMGSAHPLMAPYQAFRAKDGWINIGAANQANWERLADLIGAPELKTDARFIDNAARMARREELAEILNARLAEKTAAEWLAAFDAGGLPAGPVLSITEMHAHPQTAARNMAPEVDHPKAGRVKTIGPPVKFSGGAPGQGAPGQLRPAPLLGQHTREVLAQAGFSESEITAMIREGAAADSDVADSGAAEQAEGRSA
ncbi:MAG: CaiB/BaiF CoA transferase family protein [Rhodospirillales bacterium]